jgi:ornithine cyclodeaminase/alanine dehydrogenase-like protein (mu-crystallin family)
VLILTRSDTEGLLELEECVDAVELAFRVHGEGRALSASRRHVPASNGGFHVTAGGLPELLSVKVNGQFPPLEPGGRRRLSGVIVLSDATDGRPLALLDSLLVTVMRTAAVTAVAARHLAPPDAESALVVGAGRQARGQIRALLLTLPLRRLEVHDRHPERAAEVAEFARGLGLDATPAADLGEAARAADVIVTATPATTPVLSADDAPDRGLIVAIGADGPGKQELDSRILAQARLIVDVTPQATVAGELARAIEQGLLTDAAVAAELGEVVAGIKPGRTRDDELVVFDSTGTGLQDAAVAALVLERARAAGRGYEVDLSS